MNEIKKEFVLNNAATPKPSISGLIEKGTKVPKTFKEMNGFDIDKSVLFGIPNFDDPRTRHNMQSIFDNKNKLGGWYEFNENNGIDDFVYVDKNRPYDTYGHEDEGIIRRIINGENISIIGK